MSDHPPTHSTPPNDPATNSLDDASGTNPIAATVASDGVISARDSHPPASTGRYLLGDEIARGGMGVVYRATDTALGREVAVKVLLDRYAPAGGTARRFAHEARVTGQLQHPAIPPVHDLGTLRDGRPFLAMKLIKGQTLDALLAARPGPDHISNRFLAVFEQVCQAVAYAHAHAVIHRDLKPANVMVGNYGEVQVMDWGLAKLLVGRAGPDAAPDSQGETAAGTVVQSQRESDGALTQAGSVLGTPAFMPPEQAIGAVDQIDARSDVFGLGALLCALLTGKPPFVAETAESARQAAAKGKVADAFSRLDASGAEPDLVALCKRCLAPEKEARPAHAGQVAGAVAELRTAADERARRAEVDRAAADVRAGEERKRRRGQLVFGGIILVALLAGIGGTTWGLIEAKKHEARAIDERDKKELARSDEAAQHARADASAARANATVDEYFTRVSENKLLKSPLPGLQPLRKELLEAALTHYRRFVTEQKDDPNVRVELARAYFRVGRILGEVGNLQEAEDAQRSSVATWGEVLRQSPEEPGYLRESARARVALASVLERKREVTTDWEEHVRSAEKTFLDLVAADGADVDARQGLADLCSVAGTGYDKLGRHELEAAYLRRAYAEWEKVAAADPKYAADFASAAIDLGYCYTREGKPAEALRHHERARDEFARLVSANPADTGSRVNLSRAYTNIGYLHTSVTNKPGLAVAAFEASVREAEPLVRDHPAVVTFRLRYCVGLSTWGKALMDSGQPGKAGPPLRQAIAELEGVLRADPNQRLAVMELGLAYGTLGRLEAETGQLAAAIGTVQKACDTLERLVSINPLSTDDRGALARSHRLAGVYRRAAGDLKGSRASLERALAVLEEPPAADRPTNVSYLSQIIVAVYELGRTLRKSGDLDAAEKAYARVDALWNGPLNRDPQAQQLARYLSVAFSGYGSVLRARGRPDAARHAFENAVKLARNVRSFDFEDLFELAGAAAQLSALPEAGKTDAPLDPARYADEAMRYLNVAVSAGRSDDLKALTNDDLAPLRARADFRQLVAKLEARHRPREPAPPPRPVGRE